MTEKIEQASAGVASELNTELGFEDKRYVVVGNFAELDSSIRLGSKVYVVGGRNGDGFQTRKCVVRFRHGNLRSVWVNMKKLKNFRAAWLPQHIKEIAADDSEVMTKDEAVRVSILLNERHTQT